MGYTNRRVQRLLLLCVVLAIIVIVQHRGCVALDVSRDGPPILSLCETGKSRTSLGSVVMFHPVQRTYSISEEIINSFSATIITEDEKPQTHNALETNPQNGVPSTSKQKKRQIYPSNLQLPTKNTNQASTSGSNISYQRQGRVSFHPGHEERAWGEDRANSITLQEGVKSVVSEHSPDGRSEGTESDNMRDKRSVITGPVCSCAVRPRGDNPVFMSVMVTFYRLTSEIATPPTTQHTQTPASCPKLSLVYDGSKVQPLACLGLGSKAVTSFQLPPIRLKQLGIKLERESRGTDRTYAAAFVVNVTVDENTELISSCNTQGRPDGSGPKESTTIRDSVWDETRGTRGESTSTGTIPIGAGWNNGQPGRDHGGTPSSSARHEDGESSSGGGDVTTRQTIESSSLTISSSSSPSSSSTLEGSGRSVTPTVTGNGTQVVLASLGKSDEEDDSSPLVLVVSLTTLVGVSIVCGLVFFVCRIRRLRKERREDQSATGLRHTRPYRVISLSRLLHRISSQGTRTRPVDDSFRPSPSRSPRYPANPNRHDHHVNNENQQQRHRFTIGRTGQRHHGEEESGEVPKRNGINVPSSRQKASKFHVSSSSHLDGHSVNDDIGNSTGVNNLCNGPERDTRTTSPISKSNWDSLIQVAPPVPPRRRYDQQDNQQLQIQSDFVTKIDEKEREKTVDLNSAGGAVRPNHDLLSMGGLNLPYAKELKTTENENEDGGENTVEDESDGKYSMARVPSSVQLKRERAGRGFGHFWRYKVFGRIAKMFRRTSRDRRQSGDSGKSRGYWVPGDVGPALDEASSDGYESYMGKADDKWSSSGCYRSYDMSDNYEVARVYVHNGRKGGDRYHGGAVFDKSNGEPGIQDIESASDGYDDFIISRECGDPDCQRKEISNTGRNVGLDLKTGEFDLNAIVDNRRRRADENWSFGKRRGESFVPNFKESNNGKSGKDNPRISRGTEANSITIKYAEPKIKIGNNADRNHKTGTRKELHDKGIPILMRSQNENDEEGVEFNNNNYIHDNANNLIGYGKYGGQQHEMITTNNTDNLPQFPAARTGRHDIVLLDQSQTGERQYPQDEPQLASGGMVNKTKLYLPDWGSGEIEDNSDVLILVDEIKGNRVRSGENEINSYGVGAMGVMTGVVDGDGRVDGDWPVSSANHRQPNFVSLIDSQTDNGQSSERVDQSEC